MKRSSNYRIKFHSQLSVIGMLASIGLFAICGEPDESLAMSAWLGTLLCQIMVTAICWVSAWLLCRRWGLNRKMNMLSQLQH